MTTKLCTSGSRVPGCGRELTLDSFHVKADGTPFDYCKDCVRRRRRTKDRIEDAPTVPIAGTCLLCGETKPASDFAYKAGSGGRLREECRKCVDRARLKKFRSKNKARE